MANPENWNYTQLPSINIQLTVMQEYGAQHRKYTRKITAILLTSLMDSSFSLSAERLLNLKNIFNLTFLVMFCIIKRIANYYFYFELLLAPDLV